MKSVFFSRIKVVLLVFLSASLLTGGTFTCSAGRRKHHQPELIHIIWRDPVTNEEEVYKVPYNPYKRDENKISISKMRKKQISINKSRGQKQLKQYNQHLDMDTKFDLSEIKEPLVPEKNTQCQPFKQEEWKSGQKLLETWLPLTLPQINRPDISTNLVKNSNSDCPCPPKVMLLKQLAFSLPETNNHTFNVKSSNNFNS